jgi:hypothetical protein
MDPKLEKYYDYIVDDMVKRTIINPGGFVTLPFFPEDLYYTSVFDSRGGRHYEGIKKTYLMDFWEYVKHNYGAHEDEMATVYQMYVDMIETKLIDMGYIRLEDEY